MIYILQLSHDKWYVGSSDQPFARIQAHMKRQTCLWVQENLPILDIITASNTTDTMDELKETLYLMNKKGISNVRGSVWTSALLPQEDLRMIERLSDTLFDRCYGCHDTGHFYSDCPKRIKK